MLLKSTSAHLSATGAENRFGLPAPVTVVAEALAFPPAKGENNACDVAEHLRP
jgi:hypothetical protein